MGKTLILYDTNGQVWSKIERPSGDVQPPEYPVGINYIEVETDELRFKVLNKVDVTVKPHKPVYIELPHEPTTEELIKSAIDKYTKELIEGGIL